MGELRVLGKFGPRCGLAAYLAKAPRSLLLRLDIGSLGVIVNAGCPWEWPRTHRIPRRIAFGFVAVRWWWEGASERHTIRLRVFRWHIAAMFDRAEDVTQVLLAAGRFGGTTLSLLMGVGARAPFVSFGTLTHRIGLGEWQDDAPRGVRGWGPFWMTGGDHGWRHRRTRRVTGRRARVLRARVRRNSAPTPGATP